MESDILKLASTQGIWSVLSIFLIFYIIKTQKIFDERQNDRENNYQILIKDLTDRLKVIEKIYKEIKSIKKI
ncbi:BhlA/UviB family holin-like peptide [Clostridioides difficile]|nr:BhlA/UviB family holin-like peptide [Clostridioides difficile]